LRTARLRINSNKPQRKPRNGMAWRHRQRVNIIMKYNKRKCEARRRRNSNIIRLSKKHEIMACTVVSAP